MCAMNLLTLPPNCSKGYVNMAGKHVRPPWKTEDTAVHVHKKEDVPETMDVDEGERTRESTSVCPGRQTPRVDKEEIDNDVGKADPTQDPQAAPLSMRKRFVRERKGERLEADEGDARGGQERRTFAAAEHACSTPWSKWRAHARKCL